MSMQLHDYLDSRRREIDRALGEHLPGETTPPPLLHEAMRYCVLAGGKRIRPILAIATAEAMGATPDNLLFPSMALEVFHTYTLVHDDLPCMDNDDLRRGLPTAHKKFGEANAVLAGDALLTLAFEWAAENLAPSPYLPTRYAIELAQAGGSQGVVGGQVQDLALEGQPGTARELDYIHLHKTAALIRCAVRIGAISAAVSPEELNALSTYGCDLGLAFQVVDDILDETSSTEKLGKPIGSDRDRNKLTYVSLHGMEAARKRAEALRDSALDALAPLAKNHPTARLEQIARFVVDRTN